MTLRGALSTYLRD